MLILVLMFGHPLKWTRNIRVCRPTRWFFFQHIFPCHVLALISANNLLLSSRGQESITSVISFSLITKRHCHQTFSLLFVRFRRGFKQFFRCCPFVHVGPEVLTRREVVTSRYSCSGSPDHHRIVRNGKSTNKRKSFNFWSFNEQSV